MISKAEDLKQIYLRYAKIYEEIKEIEDLLVELGNRQRLAKQRLTDNREAERFLINKIEKEIGRALTQEDLLEMIHSHGK